MRKVIQLWDKIWRPKCEQGLGIRKTEDADNAFLAKKDWKTLTQPNNLDKLMKANILGITKTLCKLQKLKWVW